MLWTVKFFKIIVYTGLFSLGLCVLLLKDESSILIQSLESKTSEGKPVFNKIKYETTKTGDVWFMEQSHLGVEALKHTWDKIAIVVDKTKKPFKATFMQLEPGFDKISLKLEPVDLKASCYTCHSNGPRAIRPDLKSLKLSYWNRARVTLWNLKIKSYGPMKSEAVEFEKPFKYSESVANHKLRVEACTFCHNDQSFFGRGALTRQNFASIKFMVENKLMPPPGFSLKEKDHKEVYEFIGVKPYAKTL